MQKPMLVRCRKERGIRGLLGELCTDVKSREAIHRRGNTSESSSLLHDIGSQLKLPLLHFATAYTSKIRQVQEQPRPWYRESLANQPT